MNPVRPCDERIIKIQTYIAVDKTYFVENPYIWEV
jgi:hypothetical protein